MAERFPDLPEVLTAPPIRPPLTEKECRRLEARLGFDLPRVVRMVYTDVADGGFGPGYGLYRLAEAVKEDARARAHAECSLPDVLVAICSWGCGIYSYVDCSHREAPVYRLDTDGVKDEDAEYLRELSGWSRFNEAPSFQMWLESWLNDTLRS
jgi:hypothetical protein